MVNEVSKLVIINKIRMSNLQNGMVVFFLFFLLEKNWSGEVSIAWEIEANNRNGQQIAEGKKKNNKPIPMSMYGEMGKVLRMVCTQTKMTIKKKISIKIKLFIGSSPDTA